MIQYSERQAFLITGGSGFIGQQLCRYLLATGSQVTVLTRNAEKSAKRLPESVKLIQSLSEISAQNYFYGIVNLAGEPIANSRWSEAKKAKLYQSRIETTNNLMSLVARLSKKPSVLINASAIGYYGIHADEWVDEETEPQAIFMSELCQAWEQSANKAKQFSVRVCIVRIGLVLGLAGGILPKMLPVFKFGLGGRLGSGQQWMSWIHLDDLINLIGYLIKHETLTGVYNATAPQPVTNIDFTNALGKLLHRPTFLITPGFLIKCLLGEMGKQLLLSGQRVSSKKAQQEGFEFSYPELHSALASILNER